MENINYENQPIQSASGTGAALHGVRIGPDDTQENAFGRLGFTPSNQLFPAFGFCPLLQLLGNEEEEGCKLISCRHSRVQTGKLDLFGTDSFFRFTGCCTNAAIGQLITSVLSFKEVFDENY